MEIEIKNAIIMNASIHIDRDHQLLTADISLNYGDGGQCFGGIALYLPKDYRHHSINGPAGHWIYRVMEIVGVTEWSDLQGKPIRVKATSEKIHAIGHIIKDDWFCPSDDFKKEQTP